MNHGWIRRYSPYWPDDEVQRQLELVRWPDDGAPNGESPEDVASRADPPSLSSLSPFLPLLPPEKPSVAHYNITPGRAPCSKAL